MEILTKEEILKALGPTTYTIYGDAYAVVEEDEESLNVVSGLPPEIVVDSTQGAKKVHVVSLRGAFESEEDAVYALQYCECYTGS